jgi:hypothetical protein
MVAIILEILKTAKKKDMVSIFGLTRVITKDNLRMVIWKGKEFKNYLIIKYMKEYLKKIRELVEVNL